MSVELIRNSKSDVALADKTAATSCPNCGHTVEQSKNNGRTRGKTALVVTSMVLSGIYLLNPDAGVFEFLPDVIPGIGNIDEGLASAILLGGLRYFGFDWLPFKLTNRR